MPKTVSDMSVADLEKALQSKRGKLDDLSNQRDRLRKQLESVEGKIQTLGGTPADPGKQKGGRRGKRVKNAMPLSGYVEEVLGRTKKGFTVDEVEQKVLEAGYKTNSKNFRNVVYQCLYHAENIVQDEKSGRHQLMS